MYQFGGFGVDVKLANMRNTADIVWVNGNSYVRVAVPDNANDYTRRFVAHVNDKGEQYLIVSVNGMGEVRWYVNSDYDLLRPENKQVADYFKAGQQ